jgi:hypothetical protein
LRRHTPQRFRVYYPPEMSRGRMLRSRIASITLLGSLLSGGSVLAQDAVPTDAQAELAAARALFAEALHDEEEGRLAMALEKFRRVRDVRDTASVEYRIATCEEGLGHLVVSATTYQAAIRLGEGSPETETVAAGARERLQAVQKRVGHLTLTTTSPAPADREVLVDGAAPSTLTDIPIDPGPHVITARAAGALPFRTEVTLPDGARLTVSIPLLPSALPEPVRGDGSRTVGWISTAGGAALLAGSGIVALVRLNDIGSLNNTCPLGDCPSSANESSLNATRSRALAEGPIAVGLAAAGAIAAGAGLFILLRPSSRAPSVVSGVGASGAIVGGMF